MLITVCITDTGYNLDSGQTDNNAICPAFKAQGGILRIGAIGTEKLKNIIFTGSYLLTKTPSILTFILTEEP